MAGENEKKEFQRRPQPTFDIADFYNYEVEGGARLKVSIWGDRVIFAFSTWDAAKKTRNEEKIWINHDLLLVIEGIVKDIVLTRVDAWKNKKPYPEFDIPLNNAYSDREGVIHEIGKIHFRTVQVKEASGVVNRVQIGIDSVKNGSFFVTFGNKLINTIISASPDLIAKVDPIDTALYRFAFTISQIAQSAVLYSVGSKLAELIVGNSGNAQAGGGNRGGYSNDRGGNREGRSSGGRFQTDAQEGDASLNF